MNGLANVLIHSYFVQIGVTVMGNRGYDKRNSEIESLALESTVSERGQITLPKQVRDMLNLKAGGKVGFYKTANGIVLKNRSISYDFMNLVQALSTNNNVVVSGGARTMKSTIIMNLLEQYYDKRNILIFSGNIRYREQYLDWYANNEQSSDKVVFSILDLDYENREKVVETLKDTEVVVVDYSDFPLPRGVDKELFMEELLKDYEGIIIIETQRQVENWYFRGNVLEIEVLHSISSLAELGNNSILSSWELGFEGDYVCKTLHKPY